MAFQTPITVRSVLRGLERNDYVLPAIQREFVWRTPKIAALFDSLLRGYPIGSFLFWQVQTENSRKFKFYDCVLNYHERDAPHCPPLTITSERPLVAILDGQQRLTAFNIGLRGSHSEKEPRKWWNNPDAFPVKHLYLNLLSEADENDDGLLYDFRFLTKAQALERGDGQFWYRVADVLSLPDDDEGPVIHDYLMDHDLMTSRLASRALFRLHRAVHKDNIINFFREEEQDLDKVLNVFIRVNSGATVLSYSDLLLSIATAQWEPDLDARRAIYDLVDDLNGTRDGFAFSKDFVLKAGLMLSDIASVGFKVTNFDAANMTVLRQNWPKIEGALRLTARLAADFGLSSRTLPAESALLPVAYYLYQRGATDSYLLSTQYQEDREAIRCWLMRSLLKSGIWSGGLDTRLTILRTAIKDYGQARFPVDRIEAAMARQGRSLAFDEAEIEDLLDTKYTDRRAFTLLALLYPFIDLRNDFHIDHVFPVNSFTPTALRKAGLPEEQIEPVRELRDGLANLQFLAGPLNSGKRDKPPHEWLEVQHPDLNSRREYVERHDLGQIPDTINGFVEFYEQRRALQRQRLKQMLTAASTLGG